MTEQQIKRLGEDKLRTIYNNIKATHNMVNIQQVKGSDLEIVDTDKYDYMLTYSFPCVTESTLVLTEKGYIPFRELNVGDKVLTKSNTWQKVVKQFDNGVASVYLLNASGTAGIECTKEHKFYVREMYRKGHKAIRCFKEPIMKHAKDLITSKDYLGIPVIKDETPFYTDDVNFWYLIGMYLGDGWLHKSAKDIRFGFNDKKIEKFSELGYPYSLYDNINGCKHLRINNKEIYAFIEKYIGTGSNDKHIPIEILNLPKKQLQALYDGYLVTDGCIIGNKHQFSSINESMSYSVVSIIHKLYNRPAYIYKIKTAPKKLLQGREVNQRDWYQIRFKLNKSKQDKAFYDNGYIWFPFKSLTYLREDSVYNMEIENDHSYIINGVVSANCQDLSNAGLGKGMSADSGTRSSLLWQVGRVLDECKELNHLPNVLLLENVPQVHGTKNIADFNIWIEKLNSLGYTSDWADLNTKNYGVPQNRNRTFMISRLNTTQHFNFPKPITLINKLKDLLEDEVDEKYYLSDTIASKLKISDEIKEKIGVDLNDRKSELREITSTIKARYDCGYEHFTPGPTGVAEPTLNKVCNDSSGNNFNAVYNESGMAMTLLARDYKDPMRVAIELKQIGQMYPSSGNPQAGRIYTKDGLSPCLDTCTGGNREVKILEEPFICASRGRNSENPNCRDKGQELEQRLEPKFDGTSNCLTTVTKDNYVCEPTCTPLQKEVCNKALEFMKPNDSIDYTYSNSRLKEMESGYIKTKNSEDNNIMNTITTNADSFGVCVEDNLKRQLCNKLVENGMVEEEDVIRHSYTNNRLGNGEKNMGRIESKEKLCPTLDTRCDCLGVCVSGSDRFDSNMFSSTEKKLFTKDGNIKRYINSDVVDEFKEGQMATTSFPNGYGHGPRTHDESITLNTLDKPCVKKNLRIRKLTPNECFRLQGVTDDDFKNCAVNQSNASLYHLAGDSITTTTLMAIFGTLLDIDWKQKAVEQGLIKVSENDAKQEVQPTLEKFSWDI